MAVATFTVMKPTTAGLVFAGSVATAALAGSQFNPNPDTETGHWYGRLEKSPLTPPNAVFGPVWSTLYALIAYAGWRLWRTRNSGDRRDALRLWSLQLGLNSLWSPLFFGARKPKLALADLAALLLAQTAYIRKARRVDRVAAWLFIPYVIWCSFAAFLNAEIVRRN